MNRLKSLIVLSLMLFVGGQMMGQTHGTMFLGATIPTGDFAMGSDLTQTALLGNGDQTYGGAAIGFNAGLKWDFGVGIKGLAVILSVDGIYNGPNGNMKDYYKEVKEDLNVLYDDVELTTPRYINVPLMLGARYTYYLNSNLGIYAEAGVGADVRFITDYVQQYTFNELITGAQVKHKNTWDFASAFTFAYQAGLGIEVSRNLVIGCSLYDLGTAPVEGEVTYKTGSSSNTTSFESGKLHSTMVLGRIGFRF